MSNVRIHSRAIVLLALTISAAAAQTLSVHRTFGPGATVEAIIPDFETHPGQESSALILRTTLRLRVGEGSVFQVAIPYLRYHSRYTFTSPFYTLSAEERDDGLMNLALGIITQPGGQSAWEFHTTVPLVSKENASLGFIGLMSDFDRFESYLRNMVTVGVYGNLLTEESSMLVGRLRLGPTAWIPTEGSHKEIEAAADAGVGLGLRIGPVEGGAFLSSRTILTEEEWFDTRTLVHTTLSIQILLSHFRVQAFYRFPHNDELRQGINGSIGIAGSVTW